MATQLVQLKDGVWVEVEGKEPAAQFQEMYSKGGSDDTKRSGTLIAEQISGGGKSAIATAFDEAVRPLLEKVCQPFENLWSAANKNVEIEQAEVEIGISAGGEGAFFFLAKASADANLKVKLTLKPKKPEKSGNAAS